MASRQRSRSRSPPRRRRSPSPSRDQQLSRKSQNASQSRSPSRRRSRSPPPQRGSPQSRRAARPRSPSRSPRGDKDFPWDSDKKKKGDDQSDEEDKPKKVEPNFQTSGLLTAETNTYRGYVIKYNEPQDAQVPKLKWRLHAFKEDEELPIVHLYRQSAFLVGRERKICELPLDHPSISKQHAVLQFRKIPEPLTKKIRVKLYIIDLGSTNGTFLNGERIEAQRYFELKEKDILKFGFSSREYVVLNERSAGESPEEAKEDA